MEYKICRKCGQRNEFTNTRCTQCGLDLTVPASYDIEMYGDGSGGIVRIWSPKLSKVFAFILTVVMLFGTYVVLNECFGNSIRYSLYNSQAVRFLQDTMGVNVLDYIAGKGVMIASNATAEGAGETEAQKTKEKKKKATTKKKKNNGYILKNSSKKLIPMSTLKKLSKRKLAIARNEIFARNGYTFKGGEWQKYFSKKSWYKPKYSADYFNDHYEELLNKYEKKNIRRIKKVEKQKGA